MVWFNVTFSNVAYWSDADGHNGYSMASLQVTLRVLAHDMEDAIERGKKACASMTRKADGTHNHVNSWRLTSVYEGEQ